MSSLFAKFASRYYDYTRDIQGRKLEWHQAQAEASALYTKYKSTYQGDLHAEPCDRWFEAATSNGTCVRTVGKSSRPSQSEEELPTSKPVVVTAAAAAAATTTSTTTANVKQHVKSRIDQWRQARVSRKRLLRREHNRTHQLVSSFRKQRETLEARIQELSDLVASKDADLQAALREESESWNAHDQALEQIQTFLQRGRDEVESKAVEQEELVDDLNGASGVDVQDDVDLFRGRMNQLESETHEQLKLQRAAYKELQVQLADANDRLFQTVDQHQKLQVELAELQELQQQESAELEQSRTQLGNVRTELLQHSKVSTQEAQIQRARIKALEAQLASNEDQTNRRKEIDESTELRNATLMAQTLQQSRLLTQKDADISRLQNSLDETQALLSTSRQESVKRNAQISAQQRDLARITSELSEAKETIESNKIQQKRDQERIRDLQRRVDALLQSST